MIQRLQIGGFRNIDSLSIEPKPGLNLLLGPNGSGKTSVLEAVCVLATGRSFRTSAMDTCIQRGAEQCWVSAKVAGTALGWRRVRGGTVSVRMDGAAVVRSELTQKLPLAIIHIEIHQLISGAPQERRRFLDRGLFHMEPSFYPAWQSYNRALQQRNALLRQTHTSAVDLQQLKVWDARLREPAEVMTHSRRGYVSKLSDAFGALLRRSGFTNHLPRLRESISLSLKPGWPTGTAFPEVLEQSIEQDVRLGYTQWGPHRADLGVKLGGVGTRGLLSGAEQRVLAILLVLAQTDCWQQHSSEANSLLLLDEVGVELDERSRQMLTALILTLDAQTLWALPELESLGDMSDQKEYQQFLMPELLASGGDI